MAQYNINKIQLPNGDICNIEVEADSDLSLISTNPVQNKVIAEALANIVNNLEIEVIRL